MQMHEHECEIFETSRGHWYGKVYEKRPTRDGIYKIKYSASGDNAEEVRRLLEDSFAGRRPPYGHSQGHPRPTERYRTKEEELAYLSADRPSPGGVWAGEP